jgi:hypothetical protein
LDRRQDFFRRQALAHRQASLHLISWEKVVLTKHRPLEDHHSIGIMASLDRRQLLVEQLHHFLVSHHPHPQQRKHQYHQSLLTRRQGQVASMRSG